MAEWKTRSDVKKLSVSNKEIGQGDFGRVYLGRLHFKGTSRSARVAVKEFHKPVNPFHYETVIDKMRRAGLPIIKMGFLQHRGKWVQVTPLFGSKSRGSTIRIDGRNFENDMRVAEALRKPEKLDELLGIIAGVANLGYLVPRDSIAAHLKQGDVKFLIHDIDIAARAEQNKITATRPFILDHLSLWAKTLSTITGHAKKDIVKKLQLRITHDASLEALKIIERGGKGLLG